MLTKPCFATISLLIITHLGYNGTMERPQNPHERHIRVGRYLKDVVYAANDGIITTFAVVAATVGGGLAPATILILGMANLFADGFSMATGNYLGTKSDQDFYKKEEAEEWEEVRERPEDERAEVRTILTAKGFTDRDLEDLLRLMTSRKQFWIDFMMHEELQLHAPKGESAVRSSVVTFMAFIIAGSIPLLPYILFGEGASFAVVSGATATTLFIVGSLRAYFSKQSWVLLGLQMLVIGGAAAAIAYAIGAAIRSVV